MITISHVPIPQGYVKCTSPKSAIGYVMVCYGCVSTLFYASLGTVIRHIRRLTVIMAGTLFNLGWVWKCVFGANLIWRRLKWPKSTLAQDWGRGIAPTFPFNL